MISVDWLCWDEGLLLSDPNGVSLFTFSLIAIHRRQWLITGQKDPGTPASSPQ